MKTDGSDSQRTAWVWPSLSWDVVNKVKARLSGSSEPAPRHVRDIELTNMSHQFFSWWLEARGNRSMPMPDDVSPKALVELLPYFRLLRWESENSLVFRIFGSALAETTGFDLTGHCTFGEADYEGKTEDVARLKLMHSHPCGLLLHRALKGPDGKNYICELINLPISSNKDGKNRIVGTVVTRNEVGEMMLDFKLVPPLRLARAVFIDIGFGVPENVPHLEL